METSGKKLIVESSMLRIKPENSFFFYTRMNTLSEKL